MGAGDQNAVIRWTVNIVEWQRRRRNDQSVAVATLWRTVESTQLLLAAFRFSHGMSGGSQNSDRLSVRAMAAKPSSQSRSVEHQASFRLG